MHINELSKILNQYFNFHKARSDCLAQLVIAMIAVKTVNFTHLATAFITKSFPESCYFRGSLDFSSLILLPLLLW